MSFIVSADKPNNFLSTIEEILDHANQGLKIASCIPGISTTASVIRGGIALGNTVKGLAEAAVLTAEYLQSPSPEAEEKITKTLKEVAIKGLEEIGKSALAALPGVNLVLIPDVIGEAPMDLLNPLKKELPIQVTTIVESAKELHAQAATIAESAKELHAQAATIADSVLL